MSIPFKERDGFDVMGLGKHVYGGDLCNPVAATREQAEIAGQGCRIAGDRDNLLRSKLRQEGCDFAQPLARRVEQDAVESLVAGNQLVKLLLDITGDETGLQQTGLAAVAPCPVDAFLIMLNTGHLSALQPQGNREIAHAAEEIKCGKWFRAKRQQAKRQLNQPDVLLGIDLEKTTMIPAEPVG